MNEKRPENTVPIAVLSAIKSETTVFSICRNEDDGTLFLQSLDAQTGMGTILFVKAEELRQFGRSLIGAANSVRN